MIVFQILLKCRKCNGEQTYLHQKLPPNNDAAFALAYQHGWQFESKHKDATCPQCVRSAAK